MRIIASLLLLVVAAFSQAAPETVGLSSERLQRISSAVQEAIEGRRIAGMVTLVSRKGQTVWLKAQGMADVESNKQMRTDNLFRICSMTKPITSLAVMMLYEEGKFLLGDPISKFLPEFRNPQVLAKAAGGKTYTVPAQREITIRDLLRHTSGLTYHWNTDLGPEYAKAGVAHGLLPVDFDNAENVKRLASAPLAFQPGERFEYSLSVDVLGRLVEVVSGMSLDRFFQQRIFAPLGMTDTYFYVPEEKQSRLAAAYTFYAGKGLGRFPEQPIAEPNFQYSADYPIRGSKKLFAGGAGLSSTAEDYAKFCRLMLNGGKVGGKLLISRKSIELMTHDQLGRVNPEFAFGLGFGTNEKVPLAELGSAGSYFWGGFFYTSFIVDPKEQMIVISMAQLHPDGDLKLNETINTLAYQAIID